jgi:hypothetical protein
VVTVKEKSLLLSDLLRAIRTASQLKPATEEAISLARLAAEQNQFPEAFSLLDLAVTTCKRVPNSENLRKSLVGAREVVSTREKEWKAFQAASSRLETNPDDPAANFSVGRWHLANAANWELALPLLAKSIELKWKAAAILEQSSPTDATAQAAIGDAWYALAEKESGSLKTALLLHAARWYEAAQPNLVSALMKQLIAKRLAEIAPLNTTGPMKAIDAPTSPTIEAKPSSGWIDLLEMAQDVDWSPRGIDWNTHIEGPATKSGITLKSDWCRRFPIPAIVDGGYELEFEFTRLEGSDAVGILFPVQMHNMHLQFGNFGGCDDLRFIAGNDGNPLTIEKRPSAVTANLQKHRIVLKVEIDGDTAQLAVSIDQREKYLAWEGPVSRLHNQEPGEWRPSMIRHFWLTAMNSKAVFHTMRVRSLSGTILRDVITDSDRAQDLKNGFVRLVGERPIFAKVGWKDFTVNQLPLFFKAVETERLWPFISRDFAVCQDFYGAHAPSTMKCPIPTGAKSFSVVGYNDGSRAAEYFVFIDGVKAFQSGIADIATVKVDIPPKSSSLELVVDPASDKFRDHTYWCYPRFHTVPSQKIADKMLDGKPTLNFVVASSSVGAESLTHNFPINTLKSVPIHYRDAKPCHEFIYAHAPSSVSYRVPPGMTRFSAIGYNVISQEVRYEVWANARKIYGSEQAGIVSIDIKLPEGTKTIDLKVHELSRFDWDFSIWCYPRLHRK